MYRICSYKQKKKQMRKSPRPGSAAAGDSSHPESTDRSGRTRLGHSSNCSRELRKLGGFLWAWLFREREPGCTGHFPRAANLTLNCVLLHHFKQNKTEQNSQDTQTQSLARGVGGGQSQMKWWLHHIFHQSFLLRAGKESCQQWGGCALPPQKPEAKPLPESVILLLQNAVRG